MCVIVQTMAFDPLPMPCTKKNQRLECVLAQAKVMVPDSTEHVKGVEVGLVGVLVGVVRTVAVVIGVGVVRAQ